MNYKLALAALSGALGCAQTATQSAPQEEDRTVNFKKGSVLVIASSRLINGERERLQAYFKAIQPMAKKYGFAPRARFGLQKVVAGQYIPHDFVGLYAWGNEEKRPSDSKRPEVA